MSLTPKTLSIHLFHWFAWVIFTILTTINYHDQTIKMDLGIPLLPYALGPVIAYLLLWLLSALESPVSIQIPSSIKIIVGLIGNIMAIHFLKDKSIHLFWLIVSVTVCLMGNLAMMKSTCQSGVFSFLAGVIVDIAGDIFGLNINMWIVGVGCAVIFIFFEYLDEFNQRYAVAGSHKTKEYYRNELNQRRNEFDQRRHEFDQRYAAAGSHKTKEDDHDEFIKMFHEFNQRIDAAYGPHKTKEDDQRLDEFNQRYAAARAAAAAAAHKAKEHDGVDIDHTSFISEWTDHIV